MARLLIMALIAGVASEAFWLNAALSADVIEGGLDLRRCRTSKALFKQIRCTVRGDGRSHRIYVQGDAAVEEHNGQRISVKSYINKAELDDYDLSDMHLEYGSIVYVNSPVITGTLKKGALYRLYVDARRSKYVRLSNFKISPSID